LSYGIAALHRRRASSPDRPRVADRASCWQWRATCCQTPPCVALGGIFLFCPSVSPKARKRQSVIISVPHVLRASAGTAADVGTLDLTTKSQDQARDCRAQVVPCSVALAFSTALTLPYWHRTRISQNQRQQASRDHAPPGTKERANQAANARQGVTCSGESQPHSAC